MGVFLALATLPPPVSVTGSAGAALGGALREWFGLGAAAFPLVPLFWAVALFGHFDRSLGRRVTILLAGLAFTVPFTAGAIYQYTDPAARALLAAGQPTEYFAPAGVLGLFLAYYLRVIGPIGEGLLALGAFSALTVSTIGWNPLERLKKREGTAHRAGHCRRRFRPRRRALPQAEARQEDQAAAGQGLGAVSRRTG